MSHKKELFKNAAELYSELGVDVEQAMSTLAEIELGIHAWQGDDVRGFESDSFTLTGGGETPATLSGTLTAGGFGDFKGDIALSFEPVKVSVTADGKPSAHYENTVALTENGTEILTL